jgi:hypothetical protein
MNATTRLLLRTDEGELFKNKWARLVRLPGWEERLASVIERAWAEPYVLGRHDCFRVACAALAALTGEDRWPQWAGRYTSKSESYALIRRYGGSFDRAFDWFFGIENEPARRARRGDIVKYVDATGEAHLGVCLAPGVAVLGERGMELIELAACCCCWRIG